MPSSTIHPEKTVHSGTALWTSQEAQRCENLITCAAYNYLRDLRNFPLTSLSQCANLAMKRNQGRYEP